MAYAHFERLSAMDLSFLGMEDGRAHMHIGSVSIYDAGPLRREDGALDIERILSFIEAQLHKVPRFRQKLAWVPGTGQPVWVDDARFNLRFHVRHTALPAPGGERLLKRMAGRVLSQEFDRGKPLWENWFVDGLEGNRFAVITKLHHCMADGIAGVAMGNLLVGADASYKPPPHKEWIPRPAPSGARLFAEEMRHRATAPLALVRDALAAAAGREGNEEEIGPASRSGFRALVETASNAVAHGTATPLNVEIGPHRRFDWTHFPFAELRAIGASADGTLNDAVLAIASGALRAFLRRRGVAVHEIDFHAVVPVSVRRRAERRRAGNRVSGLIARLPLDEPNPRARLRRVVETTKELKASGQSGAGDLLSQAIDLLPARLVGPLFRRAARTSAANMIITNVPGARVPVYLLGARQLETYPVVPLMANQALGIALLSYDQSLFWGFNSDWDAVPDLHDFVGDVEAAYGELAVSR